LLPAFASTLFLQYLRNEIQRACDKHQLIAMYPIYNSIESSLSLCEVLVSTPGSFTELFNGRTTKMVDLREVELE